MSYEPVQRRVYFVLAQYGLKPLGDLKLSYFSKANEVFSFEDASGRYYLKNCLKNNNRALLQLEIDFSRALLEAGVPCPEPMANLQGDYVTAHNGHLFLLTRYFDGATPTWNDSIQQWHQNQTLTALGKLHSASAKMPAHWDAPGRLKVCEPDTLQAQLDRIHDELEGNPEHPVADQMQPLLAQFQGLLNSYKQAFKEHGADMQVQLLHGDFHCYNSFFKDQHWAGCCDFDFTRRDLVLFDLYWCLRTFIYYHQLPKLFGFDVRFDKRTPTASELSQAVNATLSEGLPKYLEQYPLAEKELIQLELMPSLMCLFSLQFFKLSNSEAECLEHAAWFSSSLQEQPILTAAIRASLAQ